MGIHRQNFALTPYFYVLLKFSEGKFSHSSSAWRGSEGVLDYVHKQNKCDKFAGNLAPLSYNI